VRCDSRNAVRKLCTKRRIVGLPVLGSMRRPPFLNGSLDSSQIRQTARDLSSAGARKLSFRSVRPIDYDRSRAASCRSSLLCRPLAVERRASSSVCRSQTRPPILTKTCRQTQLEARSTISKFQVDRTSRVETAVDARNPVLTTAGQPSESRPSLAADRELVRFR